MKIGKEVKVGFMAVTAGLLLYFGFNFLKGIDFFSSSNKYYTLYENIDGLNVSNPVIINGYSVGRVSNIKILQDRNNLVLVELDVNEDIRLGDSTKAFLINSDFLGSKSIVLELNVNLSSRTLVTGDTLISEVDKGITDFLRESAQPVADNLGVTIRRVNEILLGLQGSGEKINDGLSDLQNSLRVFNTLIESNAGNLENLLQNLNKMSNDFRVVAQKLPPLFDKFESVADSASHLEIQKTLNQLNHTMASLDTTFQKVNVGEGTIGKLMNDDSLYYNLNRTAEDLDLLLIDFKDNPKRYVHFSIFGRKDRSNSNNK